MFIYVQFLLLCDKYVIYYFLIKAQSLLTCANHLPQVEHFV